MRRYIRNMRRLSQSEQGITGLETAIILIAFVIVASVFAFVVLSTGLVSAEKGKQTVFAGLEKAQGNLELRGAVVGKAAGTPLVTTEVTFNLSLAAAGTPILVDPAASTNTTIVNYIDAQAREAGVTYTVTEIQGNGDKLLENGELFELKLTLATMGAAAHLLDANENFSIEVIPVSGGTLLINRTMPPAIAAVMDLH